MIGELVGGAQGLVFAFGIAVVMNIGSYWFSDKIVLRMPDDAARHDGPRAERGEGIPMDANPATAHMFIIKPFSGGGITSLFSSHPPTEARVRALLGTI